MVMVVVGEVRSRRSSEREGESRGERRLRVGVEESGLSPFLCLLCFSSPFCRPLYSTVYTLQPYILN